MQIIGDILAGIVVVVIIYRVFVRFGIWGEKKVEHIIDDIKKGE